MLAANSCACGRRLRLALLGSVHLLQATVSCRLPAQYRCAPGCRLELALLGGCDVECEDQLQHLLTVHLRTRYLANDMNPAEVSGHLHNYEGSEDHKPAVYLHSRFNDLLSRYSAARPNSK